MDLAKVSEEIDIKLRQQGVEMHALLEKYNTELERINAFLKTDEAKTDRSENASYQLAVDQKQLLTLQRERIEMRIAALAENQMVLGNKSVGGIISTGSTVSVVVEGKEFQFKLVPALLGLARIGAVSVESLLGKALLGHKAGDVVPIHAAKGVLTYVINDVY